MATLDTYEKLETALALLGEAIIDLRAAQMPKRDERVSSNLPMELLDSDEPVKDIYSMTDEEIAESLVKVNEEARQTGGDYWSAIFHRLEKVRGLLKNPPNLVPVKSDDPPRNFTQPQGE